MEDLGPHPLHSSVKSSAKFQGQAQLLQKVLDLIIRETKLSENAEDIRRGEFSCSHINRGHPLLISKLANVD